MSNKYKFYNPEGIYFVSFSVVKWIDVFTRNLYKEILLDSLTYCRDNKGLRIFAWVIMTNHVHLIISSNAGSYLENIMRDFKKFTSVKIINAIKTNQQESRKDWMLKSFENAGTQNPNNKIYQFWQQDNHPIELFNNHMIEQKLDYLHNNPVVAGIVEVPEDYLFSSARDYAGIKGYIEIEILD